MQFQWYPGHMTKAKRQMQEDIKLIDLVIELVDARIPLSSRNPDIDELGKNKARLILMNKSDLADERTSRAWAEFFKEKGYYVVGLDARSKAGMKDVTAVVMEACREKIERDRKRGILNRPVRAMVVGIPNVGKSTFINSYAGKACAKTGNKPGVTKGKQWIRLNKNVELLDTPGILWPKFEDQQVGLRLALIGAIKDEILNIDELSLELIKILTEYYPGVIAERYGTEDAPVDESKTPVELLKQIAENRKCISRGNELDYSKAAALLIDEFRSGKLGKITLERPKCMREALRTVLSLLIVCALTFLLVRYVGQRTVVDGSSMEPALSSGDNLIVDKISYRFGVPKRFDVIVFPCGEEEGTYYIKRVVGLPGETVQIDASGSIYINGEKLRESYGREVIETPGMAAVPIQLAENEYFVLGDNRNVSLDSRDGRVGMIKESDIIGRAWMRIYPLDKFGMIH